MYQHPRKFERLNQGAQMQNYRKEPNYQQSKPFFRQPFHEAYYNKRVFDNSNNGDRPNQRWIHSSIMNKEKQQEPFRQRLINPVSCPIQLQHNRRFDQGSLLKPASRVSQKVDVVVPVAKVRTKVLVDVNSISLEDRIVEDEKKPRGSVSDEAYVLQAFETAKNVVDFSLCMKSNTSKYSQNERITVKSDALKMLVLPPVGYAHEVEEVLSVKSAIQSSGTKGGFGSFRRGKPTPIADSANSSKSLALDEKASGCFVYENEFSSNHIKSRTGFNCSSAGGNARMPHRNTDGSYVQRPY